MRQRDLKLFGETFTHVCDKTGRQTMYCTYELIARWQASAVRVPPPMESSDELANGTAIELTDVPVEQHHAAYCLQHRGVEEHRLTRLFEGGAGVVGSMPILFIKQADGSMLLVDGTHRYIAAFMLRMPTIPAYFIPASVAAPFIVEDAPQVDEETLLNSFSGLGLGLSPEER